MSLKLHTAIFEDAALGVRGTRTDDGTQFSLLFDSLLADSQVSDTDFTPAVRRAEGVIQCDGSGWVSVLVRGRTIVVGEHGYAHVTGWVNGRRLRPAPSGPDEPFSAATAAPVGPSGHLRISLLLLAQRDLAASDSGALCVVDSMDISVLLEREPGSKA